MLLTGRLEESGFADILRTLLRSHETAHLQLERQGTKKTVWVEQGHIVFASSSDPDERLGESMLREGLITVDEYDESSRLIRPGKRQGTILVEMGSVTPTELVQGVTGQVERIVLDLFHWRSGTYRIEIREFDTKELITLSMSTEQILLLGVRRSAGWSQVRRGLGGMDVVLARAPDADARLYRLDLSEDDMHAYTLANGRLTVSQICSMSHASSHDTSVTLYGLACCGLLIPSALDPGARARHEKAQAELTDARQRIQSFNVAFAPIEAAMTVRLDQGVGTWRAAIVEAVLDEHYDVLREVDLSGGLPAPLVIENLEDVEPGWRQGALERAIASLEVAIADASERALGGGAGQQVASAFGARRTP